MEKLRNWKRGDHISSRFEDKKSHESKSNNNSLELQNRLPDDDTAKKLCILCLGTTGSGKSSTINRFTFQRAKSSAGFERQTQQCEIFRTSDPNDPSWIDTVGWEDKSYEDDRSFQEILLFLKNNGQERIKAVIWNVIPNVRLDAVLKKQAGFIDSLKPQEIWRNVIIICKQSMKPERDGQGAIKAAEEFFKDEEFRPQIIGYRFFSDLDEDQQDLMEEDEQLRKAFNVKTNDEVRTILAVTLDKLGSAIDLEFQDCRCLDCGEVGDPRLLPLYCHMEMHHVHPQSVHIIHPLGVESYHESNVQIVEHDGQLIRPWYGRLCMKSAIKKRYSCCGKTYGKVGCCIKWACCKKEVLDYPSDTGCRKRYGCCLVDPDLAGDGCEPRYLCCGKRSHEPGCVEKCKKCNRPWGSSANGCYKKPHNVTHQLELKYKDSQRNVMPRPRSYNAHICDSTAKIKYFLGIPPVVLSKPF